MIEEGALYILNLAIDTDAFLMTLFEVDGLNCAGGDGNGEWIGPGGELRRCVDTGDLGVLSVAED